MCELERCEKENKEVVIPSAYYEENWNVPVSDISEVTNPDRNHAYITPDGTVYVLNYAGTRLIPINTDSISNDLPSMFYMGHTCDYKDGKLIMCISSNKDVVFPPSMFRLWVNRHQTGFGFKVHENLNPMDIIIDVDFSKENTIVLQQVGKLETAPYSLATLTTEVKTPKYIGTCLYDMEQGLSIYFLSEIYNLEKNNFEVYVGDDLIDFEITQNDTKLELCIDHHELIDGTKLEVLFRDRTIFISYPYKKI